MAMIPLITGVIGQVIGLIGQRGKAAQDALNARVAMMQRSMTDEFIGLYWLSPGFMAWVDADRASEWIAAVTSNAEFFQMQVAITVAVFGLGKINGRKK
jgi:hypothetical protein